MKYSREEELAKVKATVEFIKFMDKSFEYINCEAKRIEGTPYIMVRPKYRKLKRRKK